jgi:tetratricopeptide (TPR) repeat protein
MSGDTVRGIFAAAAFALAGFGAAHAQDEESPPVACQGSPGQVDWDACLAALPLNSGYRPLALINLGTRAFLNQDYATAVRYYDEAQPPNQTLLSDVTFHAFRASAYWHAGRQPEATREAATTHRMLERDPTLPSTPLEYMPPGVDVESMYVLILPVLQTTDQERYERALGAFRALPAPQDYVSYSNRAGLLQQLGDHAGAIDYSSRALALRPDDPGVLNNHCYVLYSAGRALDALPFCERALTAVPHIAAVHDSMSDVLAALGRCDEAERAIARARELDPSSASYREPIVCSAAAN